MSILTLPQQRVQEFNYAQGAIAERLGYKYHAISRMQYETGEAFLAAYFKDEPVMCSLMSRDRIFWNWWRNEWHERHEVFLDDVEMSACSVAYQRLVYQEANSVERLLTILRPPRIVYRGVLPLLNKTA
ncbi:MAG: hypothetical protein QM768_21640 [Agriterribacter sp.]